MKKIFLILLSAVLLTSCGVMPNEPDKPVVYSSFYAIDSFVKVIGDVDIVRHSVVPLGAEPHDFEPSAKDMAKLSEADLFIHSGTGIDEWVNDIAAELPDTVSIANASEHVLADGSDPHVWLSMTNAKEQLKTVCDALSAVDEANFPNYRQRYRDYCGQIDALSEEYKNAGLEGKKLFVTHGAYGYLCSEFGMEQIALEGIAGEGDPSPAKMAEVVDKMKAEGAKCIFYNPIDGDKTAQAVAREADVEALPLYTFEGDAEHRDYITTMELNLEQLKKGL